jgi:GH35 family endo-1,4-beta-xylanase
LGFLFWSAPARPLPLPEGAVLVRDGDFLDGAFFAGGKSGVREVRKTSNPLLPFTEYVRFTVPGGLPNAYSSQLSLRTSAAVKAGDAIVARFYVRRPPFSREHARADFVFERGGGDYKKSIVLPAEAGFRWRLVEAAFVSAGDYPAGKAHVNFRLGFGPQAVDLAGFEIVNYGKTPPPAAGKAGYAGREPGAKWRRQAQARIEKIRKGPVKVRVIDTSGKPVAGAEVTVRQTAHEFSFGGAISSKYLYARNREDNKARYRKLFLTLFNTATIENDLKWYFWAGERKVWADKTVAWLEANKLALRGHTLVWPGWEHLPEWLEKLKADPEKLRSAIRAHIAEEAGYYKGRVRDWDVLNEPLDHQEIISLLGVEEAAQWFKEARQADPAARLFINERAILTNMGSDSARHAAFEALVKSLLRAGAPLDGIGLQCHFVNDLTPPERILSILDRFAKLGKPLYASELDVENPDEELQADYLRDFMTAVFSHPAAEGITLWTFWEGVHLEPLPALYRRDWSRKPAALALEDLLLRQWRTELAGRSGARGEFEGRGFYGTYRVEVSAGGKTGSAKAAVSRDGENITVVLGPDLR